LGTPAREALPRERAGREAEPRRRAGREAEPPAPAFPGRAWERGGSVLSTQHSLLPSSAQLTGAPGSGYIRGARYQRSLPPPASCPGKRTAYGPPAFARGWIALTETLATRSTRPPGGAGLRSARSVHA